MPGPATPRVKNVGSCAVGSPPRLRGAGCSERGASPAANPLRKTGKWRCRTRQGGCPEGRRAFLWDAVRYPALGALGLMAAVLARRQGPTDAEGECALGQACRNCPARDRCRLPQAERARQTSERA